MASKKDQRLEKYFSYKDVTGCTLPPQAVLMSFFLKQINQHEIAGDLMEIGVYRGRSSMLFGMYLTGNQKLHLVDPGVEDDVLKDLKENILALNPSLDFSENIVIDQRFSYDLRKDVAQTKRGGYSFVHIDGGHSVADVYRDLELAEHFLNHQGIIICDDFFALSRPDVTEAVYRYIEKNPNSFKILLTAYNKAILTRVDSYQFWWIEILSKIVEYQETNWRPIQLFLYSSPTEFPTFGMAEKTPEQPRYGGFLAREECKTLADALSAAYSGK